MSVAHDEQGRISKASLTRRIIISIYQGNTFHVILVLRLCLRPNTFGDMIFKLLEQGLIVLQVTYPSMKHRIHMKTSLLLDNLATDLMLSIWACCKGQSQSSISTYQYIPVYTGMY